MMMKKFCKNQRQLEYGIESDGRNRIIFDFVSANFELHQREIFSAIVNDYTDWQVRTLLTLKCSSPLMYNEYPQC